MTSIRKASVMPSTAPDTVAGSEAMKSRHCGFTLVELLLVLFIIALLASIVAPMATKSIEQARESTLKEDLHVLRKAIDDYYADNGRYPESLALLAEKRYIRKVPVDPITDRADTWVDVRSEGKDGGIIDIRSGAEGKTTDGKSYRDW